MQIVSLTSSNVKRLKAVHIEPGTGAVVIGGRNGQGKSSVIDSIQYAMAGEKSLPTQPIRRGEETAEIVLDLGDLIVQRRFTQKGSYLTVTSPDGAKYPSPQAMLDKLGSKLWFDPEAFSRMKPKDQAETMRKLLGIDTSKLDAERSAAYERRREINAKVRQLDAAVQAAPFFADAPAELVSVGDMAAEIQRRQNINMDIRRAKENYASMGGVLANKRRQLEQIGAKIAAMKMDLAALENAGVKMAEGIAAYEKEIEVAAATVPAMVPADVDAAVRSVTEADATNGKVRANKARTAMIQHRDTVQMESDNLTKLIEAADNAKAKLLADVQFPVPGLGITDDGVTLNGLPLDQASTAEQIRLSVAVGTAMNPGFRVMLVRDGSLLDPTSLAMLAEAAQAAGIQLWIERVSEGEEVSVIIEDGEVKGAEPVDASEVWQDAIDSPAREVPHDPLDDAMAFASEADPLAML